MFKEKGLDSVSVDSIVEKPGLAKGSFYMHFQSKNAMITAFIIVTKGMEQGEFRTDFPVETIAKHILFALRGFTYE